MQPIKTIFIDLDDTLWDFTENSKLALQYCYQVNNVARWCSDYEQFKKIYKDKNDELWELYHYGKIEKDFLVNERFRFVLESIKCDEPNLDAFSATLNECYLGFLAKQSTLIPGAEELLQHLTKRFKVNILSNGFKEVQSIKLASSGIDKYIDKIVLSEDVGIAKPMRGIFDIALNLVGANADTTLMIGDNYDADVCGAKNAGWNAIYLNRKGNTIDNNVADITVNNLLEVIDIISIDN